MAAQEGAGAGSVTWVAQQVGVGSRARSSPFAFSGVRFSPGLFVGTQRARLFWERRDGPARLSRAPPICQANIGRCTATEGQTPPTQRCSDPLRPLRRSLPSIRLRYFAV